MWQMRRALYAIVSVPKKKAVVMLVPVGVCRLTAECYSERGGTSHCRSEQTIRFIVKKCCQQFWYGYCTFFTYPPPSCFYQPRYYYDLGVPSTKDTVLGGAFIASHLFLIV
jgi:hypothetical protein